MFIKLKNATPLHKNKDVAINVNTIVTMHTDRVERQQDETTTYFEDVTFLFCPPHGTWEVQESIDEVIAMINGKPARVRK